MINDWKEDGRVTHCLEAMLKFHRAEGRAPNEDDVATPAGRRAGLPARFAIDRIFSDGVDGWPIARKAYDAHVKTLPKKERP
jgi:hypothetical protein